VKQLWSMFGVGVGLISLSAVLNTANAGNAFDSQSQWMFGDWNGQRTALQQKGYDFSLGYTGEIATLLDSDHHSSDGTEYADQFAIGVHFDLNRILGWQDTEAQITAVGKPGV